jgi:hypothetical protein
MGEIFENLFINPQSKKKSSNLLASLSDGNKEK